MALFPSVGVSGTPHNIAAYGLPCLWIGYRRTYRDRDSGTNSRGFRNNKDGVSGTNPRGILKDMQAAHESNQLIEPSKPPAVFHIGLVKEGCPFLEKRKPSMGLSFQMEFGSLLGLSGTGLRLEMLNRSVKRVRRFFDAEKALYSKRMFGMPVLGSNPPSPPASHYCR
jgi:hypothetical protein